MKMPQSSIRPIAVALAWLALLPASAWSQPAVAVPAAPPAAPVLKVHNGMQDAVHFWIKSETKPQRDWKHFLIGQGETLPITLVSPDRFELMSCDGQGGEFYLGLRPLKQMLHVDPGMTVELGGIIAVGQYNERYWSPGERRWRRRQRQGTYRSVVTYIYQYSNGTTYTDQANRR
jgi:hypothetical protein